jgi:hypothetical protein
MRHVRTEPIGDHAARQTEVFGAVAVLAVLALGVL